MNYNYCVGLKNMIDVNLIFLTIICRNVNNKKKQNDIIKKAEDTIFKVYNVF